jgi:hypothetical protein
VGGLADLFAFILDFIEQIIALCGGQDDDGPTLAKKVQQKQRGIIGFLRLNRAYREFRMMNREYGYPVHRYRTRREFMRMRKVASDQAEADLVKIVEEVRAGGEGIHDYDKVYYILMRSTHEAGPQRRTTVD